MILVWKGAGILVPIIAVVLVLGANMFLESVLTQADPERLSFLGTTLSMLVSAAFYVALNGILDRHDAPAPEHMPIDPRTGEPQKLPSQHTFFWIPMRYWAIPAAAIALYSMWGFISPVISS